MPKIPDRWDDYNPFSQVMIDTKFLAIKVPLSQNFVANMPAEKQFTPSNLVLRCRQMGIRLGLVVDLTFTTRYYNPQEFTSQGILYEKIFVEGHSVPDRNCVNKFKAVVNEFRMASPDCVVAVHCTHGVNRTGYMICRYLIDVDGWPAELAISKFGEARGFPIERENYLDDLRSYVAKATDSQAAGERVELSDVATLEVEGGGNGGKWQQHQQRQWNHHRVSGQMPRHPYHQQPRQWVRHDYQVYNHYYADYGNQFYYGVHGNYYANQHPDGRHGYGNNSRQQHRPRHQHRHQQQQQQYHQHHRQHQHDPQPQQQQQQQQQNLHHKKHQQQQKS